MMLTATPSRGEFDRVRVAELIGCEPASDPGFNSELAQLGAGGGRRPAPSASGAVDDAKQGSGRQQRPGLQPDGELLEPERVHPGPAALIALCCAGNYVALRGCGAGGSALTGAVG